MKMRKFFVIILLLFIPFLMVFTKSGYNYLNPNPYNKLEKMGESYINWSEGYAIAWGTSSVDMDSDNILQNRNIVEQNAIEKAKLDLINLLIKVRVDSYKTVYNYITENKSFAVLFNKYLNQYSLSLMPVSNGYTKIKSGVVFNFFGENSLIEAFFEALKNEPVSRVPIFKNNKYIETHTYTGLVIDARGKGFVPSLFPSIYVNDKNGIQRTIFSFHHLNRERSLKTGSVRYSTTAYNIYLDRNVGPKPYFCNAMKVTGEFNTDLFISHEDALKFLASPKTSKKLEEGRILILVD